MPAMPEMRRGREWWPTPAIVSRNRLLRASARAIRAQSAATRAVAERVVQANRIAARSRRAWRSALEAADD
jgi:hypothetical protein